MTSTARSSLITGGNAGIGMETAVELAARRRARCHHLPRRAARCERRSPTIEPAAAARSRSLPLDLASFASVRAFADEFSRRTIAARRPGPDNAGWRARATARRPRTGTRRSSRRTISAHFLLTQLLREQLVASAPARVVVVVVRRAHELPRWPRLRRPRSRHGRYRSFRTYGRTKLMNILFTRELARRLDGTGVTANAAASGVRREQVRQAKATCRGGATSACCSPARSRSRRRRARRRRSIVASSPEVDGGDRRVLRQVPADPARAPAGATTTRPHCSGSEASSSSAS